MAQVPLLTHDFNQRGERVGCTAAYRHDRVPLGVEPIQVDPGQEHGVGVLLGLAHGADEHPPGTTVEVRLGPGPSGSAPCTVNDQIDVECAPVREPIPHIDRRDGALANTQHALIGAHGLGPAAVVAVDGEQGRQ